MEVEERSCCWGNTMQSWPCLRRPAPVGVKIVSIVSIMTGLLFLCLGVWMTIVANNCSQCKIQYNEGARRFLLMGGRGNLTPREGVQPVRKVSKEGRREKALEFHDPIQKLQEATKVFGQEGARNVKSGIVKRQSPFDSGGDVENIVPLAKFSGLLTAFGSLCICVGVVRTTSSISLLWNSVEKRGRGPAKAWIVLTLLETASLFTILIITLSKTGFLSDAPMTQTFIVHHDQFSFHLLVTILGAVSCFDVVLTLYFLIIVLRFVMYY